MYFIHKGMLHFTQITKVIKYERYEEGNKILTLVMTVIRKCNKNVIKVDKNVFHCMSILFKQ